MSAFVVRNRETNESVNLSVQTGIVGGKTIAPLTFLPGPAVIASATGLHSLSDGNYELTVTGAQVATSSQTMTADFSHGDDAADAFFRQFGDADGDRDVDGKDYGRFGLTFLQTSEDAAFDPAFDFDDDDDVDGQDYSRFGRRYLRPLRF